MIENKDLETAMRDDDEGEITLVVENLIVVSTEDDRLVAIQFDSNVQRNPNNPSFGKFGFETGLERRQRERNSGDKQ